MRIESLLDTIESTNVHEVVDRALKDSRAALDRLHELNRSYDREQRRNDVLRAKVKFLEERLNEREPDLDVDMEFKRSLQNFEENVKQLGHTDYDMFTYLGGKWVHIIVQSHVAKYNYPNTIHLGDVKKIDAAALPRIDLMLAGSPCTDLSFAGLGKGLVEGEQSSLFFDWWRLVQQLKPKYIFLENVRMKQE